LRRSLGSQGKRAFLDLFNVETIVGDLARRIEAMLSRPPQAGERVGVPG
jgi:hypothetical protein